MATINTPAGGSIVGNVAQRPGFEEAPFASIRQVCRGLRKLGLRRLSRMGDLEWAEGWTTKLPHVILADKLEEEGWHHDAATLMHLRGEGVPTGGHLHVVRHPESGKVIAWRDGHEKHVTDPRLIPGGYRPSRWRTAAQHGPGGLFATEPTPDGRVHVVRYGAGGRRLHVAVTCDDHEKAALAARSYAFPPGLARLSRAANAPDGGLGDPEWGELTRLLPTVHHAPIAADKLEEEGWHHDDATLHAMREPVPVGHTLHVIRHPVSGKVVAWHDESPVIHTPESLAHLRAEAPENAVEQLMGRLGGASHPTNSTYHGPGGLHVVENHSAHRSDPNYVVTERDPGTGDHVGYRRRPSGHVRYFRDPDAARAEAQRLAFPEAPTRMSRLTSTHFPDVLAARGIDPTKPLGPDELHKLGFRGVKVAADTGRPLIPQAAVTRRFNVLAAPIRRASNANKGKHVIAMGAKDIAEGMSDTAMREWYGPHAREMEHGLHRLFGYPDDRHHPDQVFAKVLVGLTSPGNNPAQNVDATVQMLQSGHGDVTRVPTHNVPAFAKWVEEHRAKGGTPVPGPSATIHDWARWAMANRYVKTGHGRRASVGYKAQDAKVMPDGTVTHVHAGGKWQPVDGVSQAPGPHTVHLPSLVDGKLHPKGWIQNADSPARGVETLRRLIALRGREGAAEWLRTEHPFDEVEDARLRVHGVKSDLKDADYFPEGKAAQLAGFLMFGPKIGSYMANIHDDKALGKYLTADMWFGRQYRRHLGEIRGGKEEIGVRDRRAMYAAMEAIKAHMGLDSIAQAQAILWGNEQKVYRALHQDAESGNLLEATIKAMKRRAGLDTAGPHTTHAPEGDK